MRIVMQCAAAGAILVLMSAPLLQAQQPVEEQKPDAPAPATRAQGGSQKQEKPAPSPSAGTAPPVHRFWDRENDWLFAGVGAGRALDYASTLNLRRRGVNEVFLTNSIVDNHPLFAGIEVAAAATSIGVSYLFHRTGHHRLERWTSIVHIGVATGGAIRNYALETPDPH